MKEISSMDFPEHGKVFYFYGQALIVLIGNRSTNFNCVDVILLRRKLFELGLQVLLYSEQHIRLCTLDFVHNFKGISANIEL
jgi:hypothetical protein